MQIPLRHIKQRQAQEVKSILTNPFKEEYQNMATNLQETYIRKLLSVKNKASETHEKQKRLHDRLIAKVTQYEDKKHQKEQIIKNMQTTQSYFYNRKMYNAKYYNSKTIT